MKKGQLGTAMLSIGIVLIIGIVAASIMWTQISGQTTLTRVNNNLWNGTNTSCVDLTDNCIRSLVSVTNATDGATINSGNYTLCNVNSGSVRFYDGITLAEGYWVDKNMNATYDEVDCNYIESSITRTIVNYLPVLMGIMLLIFTAGFIALKQ